MLAASVTAHADSYKYELDLAYDADRASLESNFDTPFLDLSVSSETDNDELGLTGTWYFDDVRTSTGPLSRAAFIGRASGLSLGYSRGVDESDNTDTDQYSFGVGVQFRFQVLRGRWPGLESVGVQVRFSEPP